MRKFAFLFAMILGVIMVTGCPKPEPEPEIGVAIDKIVAATADLYAAWDEDRTIPATVTVNGVELQVANYVYLGASALVSISKGDKTDIVPKDVRAASNPDRDSYDKDEIAVTNGPKDGKGVNEDIVTIAANLVKVADEKGQLPNQTIVYRGSEPLAFSTNRAIVTIARTLTEYSKTGQLPAKVSTEYLSGGLTLKAFAQEFVKYLDVWEANICDRLSADGSACEDNGNPLEMVHFIPIPNDSPSDSWKTQGLQYDPKYQPYVTVTIEGTTYTAAQCWEIAIRGLMNMCTTTGEAFLNDHSRNGQIPYGNGKSLSAAPISTPSAACIWGMYPWYEYVNQGNLLKYNNQEITEIGLEPIMKCTSWHVVRSFIQNANNNPLGKIGNFQEFGTTSGTLNLEGYEGLISPMREFLVLARFYKYLLDNNINNNVYDALKDVKVSFDLYNQQLPIVLKTKSLTFDATPDGAKNIEFTATGNWTAATEDAWIHLTPASGAAGDVTIAVTVDNYTETESRAGSVTLTSGDYSKTINVTQNAYVAPVTATIKDFAQAFVTCLDVWENTVGMVEADAMHKGANAFQNVHLIPIINANAGSTTEGNQYDQKYAPFWKATVGGTDYSSNQCWEIAIRGLMELCTTEGEAHLANMLSRNDHMYTLGNGKAITAPMPSYSANNKWNGWPWYESDSDGNKLVTYNNEEIKEVGIDFILKCTSWHVVRGLVTNSGNTSPLNAIGNFQQFGTGSSTLVLEGYSGLISAMREFVIMARIYKYILDNNITSNVYDAIKDVKFDFDLYKPEGAPVDNTPTIAEFATEFAKAATTWESTTGTVAYTYQGTNYKKENVHYVPDTFTITVKGKTYDKYQMHEIALNAFKTIENGGALTDKITAPKSYTAASARWHEYDGGLQEKVAKTDLLSNFATRCLNYIASNGEWPNVCGYPRTSDPVLTTYNGYVSLERDFLMMSRFFKYVMDNNITANIPTATANVEISTDLYGEVEPATIGDFVKEYVKILPIWEATTGTINYLTGENPGTTFECDVRDAHYVPSTTTINVKGRTLTTGDMLELAERSYLLLRGMDGNQTSGGLNAFAAVTPATFDTALPDTHGTSFGPASFNEYGTTYAGSVYSSNCGPLRMGSPVTADGKASTVKFDILDNFAQRHVNWPMTHDGVHSNMCGYCERLDGYYGCFSAQRALVTYAFFFKYMLDNNLTSVENIPADTEFRSENLGGEHNDIGAGPNSIKAFADAYVKLLNVWFRTTGTINFVTGESQEGADVTLNNENAHYVPTATKITINGDSNTYKKTLTSADFLEIGERAYLLLRGFDGNQTTGGLDAFATVEKALLTSEMPASHETVFGPASWNESGTTSAGNTTTGNGGHLRMGNPQTADGQACKVKFDILDNFAQRHVNWPMTHDKVHSNMCGYINRLDGYYGCFSAQRGLITYGFFFEYLLKNGLNGVEGIAADTIFRSEEFGDEN